MKTSLIRNSMFTVALVTAFGATGAALAEKCHKCDFSDEPIIVIGQPTKKGTASLPTLSAKPPAGQPTRPTLPGAKHLPPFPPVPPVGGAQQFAAKLGGGVKEIQLTCSTASTCNDLISHCAEHGGQWVPGQSNDKGQSTNGNCFID